GETGGDAGSAHRQGDARDIRRARLSGETLSDKPPSTADRPRGVSMWRIGRLAVLAGHNYI
ncbi:MAG TPA: hypothetical protein VF737_07000, partial [Gemmatimonadaceae bacterium]